MASTNGIVGQFGDQIWNLNDKLEDEKRKSRDHAAGELSRQATNEKSCSNSAFFQTSPWMRNQERKRRIPNPAPKISLNNRLFMCMFTVLTVDVELSTFFYKPLPERNS